MARIFSTGRVVALLALLPWTATRAADTPGEGLVAYWALDEGAGEALIDGSPIRHLPGTAHHAAWVPGVSGTALAFDGGDAYATTPPATSFYTPPGFTLDFHFRAERLEGMQYLVGGPDLFTRLVGSSLAVGLGGAGPWRETVADAVVERGRWYRVTLTFDGARALLYVDGRPAGDFDAAGVPLTNSRPLVLARAPWAEADYFRGLLDEIRVYERALAPEEILPEPEEARERRRAEARLREAERRFERRRHFRPLPDAERARMEAALAAGYAAAADGAASAWTGALAALAPLFLPETAGRVSGAARVFVVQPLARTKTLPDTPPDAVPGAETDVLRTLATPGEYEPAGFVVHATRDFKALRVEVGPFAGEGGAIPADAVDGKWVVCWRQDGGAWGRTDRGHRAMPVPELLLNDPDFLEHPFDRDATPLPDGKGVSVPARDADAWLPAKVAAGRNQQVQLTLRVPDDAAPGRYAAPVTLYDGAETVGRLTWELAVLPFRLSRPLARRDLTKPFTPSVYYWGQPSHAAATPLGGQPKTDAQLAAEMRNMAAHGLISPILVWQHEVLYRDPALLEKGLAIAREAGLLADGVYFGVSGDTEAESPAELAALRARVEKTLAVIRGAGHAGDVYFYGHDEASGPKLAAQIPAMRAIQAAGGKTLVAGFAGTFDALGGTLDLINWYGPPRAEEAARWHANGRRVWNYGAPQAGGEDPEVYRRHFGFMLWRADYDGAADYCYADPFAAPFHRGFNFVYPTVDGVVDTLPWEGYREAFDDVRYASTLALAAERALAAGDAGKRETARAARAFLDGVDAKTADLEWLRLRLIRDMLALIADGAP